MKTFRYITRMITQTVFTVLLIYFLAQIIILNIISQSIGS